MPHMPISLCPHDTSMSVHIPPINPLQSTMLRGTLIYMYFTLSTYVPKQICMPHCKCAPCIATVVYT